MPAPLDDRLAYALFCGVDTTDLSAVASALSAMAQSLFPLSNEEGGIPELLRAVEELFRGGLSTFQAIDTPYHDFEHTLQGTLCWCQLAANHHRSYPDQPLSWNLFRSGLVAILLHDIGYLKEEGDWRGTGAKFTSIHEQRSCELARLWLGERGWKEGAIAEVQQMIRCTGPEAAMALRQLDGTLQRRLGQMVCTADYLGQLSDPRYPDKIPALYREFEESDRYRGVPEEQRAYRCVEELYARTSEFWERNVRQRLNEDCDRVYELLTRPNGRNSYLSAIARNLRQVAATGKQRPPLVADN